ncbi:hypothetical protein [Kitasatospora sp. NPDC086791]|uniref:hypothetical protein n=1 Tax=Kitasatospora sp. NPDC086791 TaxID=3155178 RepID=UPI0034351541
MPQHLGVHPDDLLPAGHAARQLTPDEIQVIAEQAETWIDDNEIHLAQALFRLPQIPADPAERPAWAASLSAQHHALYEDVESLRTHLKYLRAAQGRGDWWTLLEALTLTKPEGFERSVLAPLFGIREAAERRRAAAVKDLLADAAVTGITPVKHQHRQRELPRRQGLRIRYRIGEP